MHIKPIRTKADYEAALKEVERLWGAEPGTPDGDRFEVLFTLVEAYEDQNYEILPPDPVEVIKYYMESRGLERKDLEPYIGTSGRVSEVLNHRRPLSLNVNNRQLKQAACPWRCTHKSKCIRDNRLIDCSPNDVQRSISICQVCMTADTTGKLRLRPSIRFCDMPTLIASLASELRIDLDQSYTGERCFVGQKLFQLVKRPVGMPVALLFASNLSPRANAGQFLDRNRPVRAFGCSNDALTDHVIGVFLKTSLLSRQALQLAFRRLRTAALQSCSQVAIVLSWLIGNSRGTRHIWGWCRIRTE